MFSSRKVSLLCSTQMNIPFIFLHSFPRTATVEWRAEWCFSLFLPSGFKPTKEWVKEWLKPVLFLSFLDTYSSVRAADAPNYYKDRCSATEEFESCRGHSGLAEHRVLLYQA